MINEQILLKVQNELDITFEDERSKEKIAHTLERGDAYLKEKYGKAIDYEKDLIAFEMLIAYCRYARSGAIEQFKHDFLTDLTQLAIHGAMDKEKAHEE